MTTKKLEGNTMIWLAAAIIIIIFAAWYLMKYGVSKPTTEVPGPAITSKSDLDTAAKSLDNTNLNQMDAEINQVTY